MKAYWGLTLGVIVLNLGAGSALAASPFLEDGIKEYNAGHFQEAVGLFGQAQSAEFNNPVLHYYLANALSRMNQTKEAIKEYRIAIALQPEGQMATFCQQALRSLGAAPPVASTKSLTIPRGLETQIAASAMPKPQIIGFLCGCPLCYRIELIMTDLQKKYGDRITFTRAVRNTSDVAEQMLAQRYNVTECPTVLVLDSGGTAMANRSGAVAQSDLQRDAEKLVAAMPYPTASASDDRTESARQSIMAEAQARVATDQRRLQEELKMIQTETNQKISDISRYRGYNYHQEIEEIQNEAAHTMESLRRDFERRQKEVFAAADSKLQALSNTAGAKKSAR
jgi:tetratricopeptide (TPR) repeat protein